MTESRHLVDTINQTDAVEDVDEEDKLGQPMLNLSTIKNWGTIDLFVLPAFRERSFPGADGRLWKSEGIIRAGQGSKFPVFVAGFDYTIYHLLSGNSDLGLLAEYLYDGRDKTGAPATLFDDDLFIGSHLAFNDPQRHRGACRSYHRYR